MNEHNASISAADLVAAARADYEAARAAADIRNHAAAKAARVARNAAAAAAVASNAAQATRLVRDAARDRYFAAVFATRPAREVASPSPASEASTRDPEGGPSRREAPST